MAEGGGGAAGGGAAGGGAAAGAVAVGGAYGGAAAGAAAGGGAYGAPLIATRNYHNQPPAFPISAGYHSWDIDHDRYEIIDFLGSGGFGTVVKARDHLLRREVAIKQIGGAKLGVFALLEHAKRVFRELRILRCLQHPFIARLLHVSCPGIHDPTVDLLNFQSLYMVFDVADSDLGKLHRNGETITDQHAAYFFFQQVAAVKFMHDSRILHRDIKPVNVLLKANNDIQVCDFGLARSFDEEHDGLLLPGMEDGAPPPQAGAPPAPYTKVGVQTRTYRAPELLLHSDRNYSCRLDTWGLGCCLAELLDMQETHPAHRREPLFPGPLAPDSPQVGGVDYSKDQLQIILERLGLPEAPEAMLARLHTPEARARLSATLDAMRRHPIPLVPLRTRYPSASPLALDLLQRLLCFYPEARISLEEALQHEYLRGVRCREDEAYPAPAAVHFGTISADNVRALIVEEIRHWNPQIPADWQAILQRKHQLTARQAQ